jgi:hypothetical protein
MSGCKGFISATTRRASAVIFGDRRQPVSDLDWLKKLDLQRWWIVAIAMGFAMAIAALHYNNSNIAIVSLGIIACGFGEWMNHRKEMAIMHRGTLTTYPRVNRPQGVALVVVGIILIGVGLYRLVIS